MVLPALKKTKQNKTIIIIKKKKRSAVQSLKPSFKGARPLKFSALVSSLHFCLGTE